ncbi:MAG: hypothetical protein QXT53_05980 [Ignisphaera sp.]
MALICGIIIKKVSRHGFRTVLVILMVFALYVLSVNAVFYTPYTIGAMALARSITSALPYIESWICFDRWADVVYVNGRCVFVGPLGLGIVLAIPMKLADVFNAKDLIVAGFAMAFLGSLSVYISAKLYETIFGDSRRAIAVAIVNGLAGPLYIYSTHVFPQAPLTLFYMLYILSLNKLCSGGGKPWAVLAGFSASMSIVLDPSTFIPIFFTSATVLAKTIRDYLKDRKSLWRIFTYVLIYIISISPIIVMQLIYNAYTTGNMFTFPEQIYLKSIGVEGFNLADIPYGLFILLVDPRKSLLVLYPLYILAIIYMPKALKRLGSYDKIVYVASIAIPILVYSSWYDVDGGLCYGPRFLTTITPLLIAPLVLGLENKVVLIMLAILGLYSYAENLVVVISTPYPSALEDLKPLEIQLITAINKFVEGIRSAYIYTIISKFFNEPVATTISLAALNILAGVVVALTIYKAKQY